MSTQDYDEIEKLFAGTWKCEKDENLDEFMTAGGRTFVFPESYYTLSTLVFFIFIPKSRGEDRGSGHP